MIALAAIAAFAVVAVLVWESPRVRVARERRARRRAAKRAGGGRRG